MKGYSKDNKKKIDEDNLEEDSISFKNAFKNYKKGNNKKDGMEENSKNISIDEDNIEDYKIYKNSFKNYKMENNAENPFENNNKEKYKKHKVTFRIINKDNKIDEKLDKENPQKNRAKSQDNHRDNQNDEKVPYETYSTFKKKFPPFHISLNY